MLQILPLLIIIPIIAIVKSFKSLQWQTTTSYFTILSLLTYTVYWHDKSQAQSKGWRMPENALHLLELIGGWPAAFVAQQKLRHKTSKRSYRIVFWLIVILHQAVALDYLLGWRISSSISGR
jgi:uncharacterized membrane protein YsdA (DUF1294 family)